MGLDQHPNNIDLMLLNSELLIFNSKYKEAYKILNFVEEIDPENREIYLQKATIYSKNNLSEEAIDILKRALTFIDEKIDKFKLGVFVYRPWQYFIKNNKLLSFN